MPKINVKSTSNKPAESVFQEVKSFLNNLEDLKKYDPELQLTFDDTQKTGVAKGSVFSAQLAVLESGHGSSVEIEIGLPMKFGLMKSMIQKKLQEKLDLALS